tara:strand:+ start:1686 stop:1874 length:189 start_codon:yes stop_codon:yes gene_type:complete
MRTIREQYEELLDNMSTKDRLIHDLQISINILESYDEHYSIELTNIALKFDDVKLVLDKLNK